MPTFYSGDFFLCTDPGPERGDVALVDDEVAVLQEIPEAEVQTVELPRAPWDGREARGGPGDTRETVGPIPPRLGKSNKKPKILECLSRRLPPPTFQKKRLIIRLLWKIGSPEGKQRSEGVGTEGSAEGRVGLHALGKID